MQPQLLVCFILSSLSSATFVIDLSQHQAPNVDQEVTLLTNLEEKVSIKGACVRFILTKASTVLLFASPDTSFFLRISHSNGFFGINGVHSIFPIPELITPWTYYHMCFSHNTTNYVVMVEGQTWYESKLEEGEKLAQPIDLSVLKTGFQPYIPRFDSQAEAFNGRLTLLDIYNRSLSKEEMKGITIPCISQQFSGVTLNWSSLSRKNFSPESSDAVMEVNITDTCRLANSNAKLISILETPLTALQKCRALGASMFMPESVEDVFDVTESAFTETMPTSNVCAGFVWLPFFKHDLGVVGHLDSKSNVSVNESYKLLDVVDNGKLLQQCYRHSNGGLSVGDIECSKSFCFICKWDTLTAFTLKGLDKGSSIETRYLLKHGYHNGMIWFIGFNEKHFIIYEQERLVWQIVDQYNHDDRSYGKVLGEFNHPSQAIGLPIGLHEWTIKEENSPKNFFLKFTSCSKTEFTCSDGTCIDVSLRCNDYFDCLDRSDESNCRSIIINKDRYRKHYPPLHYNSTIEVQVSIYLLAVNKINELEMKFTPKFRIHLRWYDFRLNYMNLLQNESNTVEKDQQFELWTPSLYFPNTDDNDEIENDDQAMIEIKALGMGKLNDHIYDLHEAMLYRGEENQLTFTRELEVDLRCPYDLRNYPFDTQTCSIQLQTPFNLRKYIKLDPEKAKIIGKTSLPQFNIIGIYFFANETTPYALECRIQLKRIPLNHLATTYAPTLCILIMALITLFIDESHFEATIMVSLTAMLVMYTLFQSISNNMPSTAYLKLLDFWLIFGLVMPFIIFVVEVSWELGVSDKSIQHSQSNRKQKFAIKQLTKFGIPAFTLGFIIAYILVVWSIEVQM